MPKAATPAKASTQPVDEVIEEEDLFSSPILLEPDTYLVKLVDLRKHEWDTPNKFDETKPNVSIMWKMEFAKIADGDVELLYGEDGGPLAFEFSTSTSTSPNSKASKWATAFLRRAPTRDEFKHLKSILLNRKALMATGQKDNGFPFPQDLYPYTGR